jgi:hypothetical protein
MSEQKKTSRRDPPAAGAPASGTDVDAQETTPAPAIEQEPPSPVQAPRGLLRHPGQVERRPPSDTQRTMIAEPLQSTLAREQDPANQLFPVVDQNCPNAIHHHMGEFCHECRGIQVSVQRTPLPNSDPLMISLKAISQLFGICIEKLLTSPLPRCHGARNCLALQMILVSSF